MTTTSKLLLAAAMIALSGCAMVRAPVMGVIYTDAKGPVAATPIPAGSLSGEACASSILGLIATGDASIEAARRNGGITKISAVSDSAFSILGIYAKYCVLVYGSSGKTAQAQ